MATHDVTAAPPPKLVDANYANVREFVRPEKFVSIRAILVRSPLHPWSLFLLFQA